MDWLLNLGYFGLFVGTFLAGTVLPLSSDVLFIGMLTLGANFWICLILAATGNTLGALVSYAMGWFAKWEWLNKWFRVKRESLVKQKRKINKYGVWLAFFSWAPLVGTLAMIALGFYKVRPRLTAILAFSGSIIRFVFWIIIYQSVGTQIKDMYSFIVLPSF